MSGTWASDWALNDIVTVAEFRKGVGNVAETTLGAAAASIDFVGLPTTYAHLAIVLYARGDTVATSTGAFMRFNADATATYWWQSLAVTNATVTGVDQGAAAVTTLYLGDVPAASAPAAVFGPAYAEVPNYAGTNQKVVTGRTSFRAAAIGLGASKNFWTSGGWTGVAAINRVTLIPGAGNFAAGTRASVYVWGA